MRRGCTIARVVKWKNNLPPASFPLVEKLTWCYALFSDRKNGHSAVAWFSDFARAPLPPQRVSRLPLRYVGRPPTLRLMAETKPKSQKRRALLDRRVAASAQNFRSYSPSTNRPVRARDLHPVGRVTRPGERAYAGRQSNTFNCTERFPPYSFTCGAKARSNFPTGNEPWPAFHQTAS